MIVERRIFLRSRPVGEIGYINTGTGHLYLVFREVTVDNGEVIAVVNENDGVIRGGPAGDMANYSDLATQTGLLEESGDAYGLPNGASPNVTPEDRNSLDITALLLGSGVYTDAQAAWAGMTAFANALSGEYRYELPTMGGGIHTSNSNATILSVLNHAGLDVRSIETADGSSYVDDITIFGHPGADKDAPTLLGSGDTAPAMAA